MTEHPRPWTCSYSESALCWWIFDATGGRIQHTEKEWFAKYVVDLANAADGSKVAPEVLIINGPLHTGKMKPVDLLASME